MKNIWQQTKDALKRAWHGSHKIIPTQLGATINKWLIRILIFVSVVVLPVVMTFLSIEFAGPITGGTFWAVCYSIIGVIGFILLCIGFFGYYKNVLKREQANNEMNAKLAEIEAKKTNQK